MMAQMKKLSWFSLWATIHPIVAEIFQSGLANHSTDQRTDIAWRHKATLRAEQKNLGRRCTFMQTYMSNGVTTLSDNNQVRQTTDKPRTNDLSQQDQTCYLCFVQHLTCNDISVIWICLNSFEGITHGKQIQTGDEPYLSLSLSITQQSTLDLNERGWQHTPGLESSHHIPWPLTPQTANSLQRHSNKHTVYFFLLRSLCALSFSVLGQGADRKDKHWIYTNL